MSKLSMEKKSKIVTLRNFSSLTWAEIAAQCECSVSAAIFHLIEFQKWNCGEMLNDLFNF